MAVAPWQAPRLTAAARGRSIEAVARGFDSKNVEWQQQQAEDARAARQRPKPEQGPEARARLERRRSLELALARVRGDLEKATRPQHRELLQRTLSVLEQQLRSLEPVG